VKKKLVMMALAALPLAALAQGAPGPGMGPGRGGRNGHPDPARVERMEKRMRLARTLGLAEALDLDAQQALKLGDALAKFDERRLAAHKQLFEAHQVLRKAAQADKAAPADVDQAIQKAFDARAQVQAIDKEAFAAISKDLSPEKRARAVLFLARFQNRFGPRGPGRGMGGPGMGPGMRGGGRGPGMGAGMGPGAMGMMGPGEGPMMDDGGPGPWADDDDD
jgi:hypothetical protein